MISIYEYNSYKEYLSQIVGPRDSRSGLRSSFAKALHCQPTYISQILYSYAHLSLEQGELLSDLLNHTKDEKQFFLLLINKDRAGTKRLERFFQEQLQDLLKRRLILTERLGGKNNLTEEQRSIYYGSWQYAAIHIALTIPKLRSVNSLASFLNIPKDRIIAILEFLVITGLAIKKGDHFLPGEIQIRLGKSSNHIVKHHSHWRLQAIDSLEREDLQDLHYSGVISLSEADIIKIKNELLQFIKKTLQVVGPSKEEQLYCLNMDFFNLDKSI